MMDNKNFIYTSDITTKNKLVKLGFTEIQSSESFFIFINDSTLKFDCSIPMNKVGFTNKLMF